MSLSGESLKGSRILVTGHTGFKGAWFCSLLQFLGVEVVGLSDSMRPTSLYSRIQSDLNIAEYFIDIRNAEELDKALLQINPVGIFHLAAQPLVLESYRNPAETFHTNILGTSNLILSAYRLLDLKFLMVITTDKVYRNENDGFPFVEEDSLGGEDPYSASKASVEIITNSLRNLPGQGTSFPIPTVRAGNVIGGGDDSDNRLLPDITRSVLENREINLRNPDSVRPWQHVLDPLNGYVELASQLLKGGVFSNSYNFGPSSDSFMTVREVTTIAITMWGVEPKVKYVQNTDLIYPEAKLLRLDSSKALNDFGWKTKLSGNEAIEWTVFWEKRANAGEDSPSQLVKEQISAFSNL